MKIPAFVRGSIAPTFTVFNDQLEIDETGQRNLLDFMLRSGAINSYFVRSGMGQMYTFSFEDVKRLAKIACSHLEGKAPVLVGCNGIWDRNRDRRADPAVFLDQAVELSRYAESVGAAGVVHTVPEAILPRPGETVRDVFLRYFTAINDAVNIPIFLYQPPGTDTDFWVTPELLSEVAALPNVVGIKVSNRDAGYIFSLCAAATSGGFAYITGDETAFYAGLYAGSPASISQGTILNPQLINLLQERFEAGDRAGALAVQAAIIRLVKACHNPVTWFKRYVTEKGLPVPGHLRRMPDNPYVTDYKPVSDEQYLAFKQVFEAEMARFCPEAI